MAIRDPLTKINTDLPDNLGDSGNWGAMLRKILGGDGTSGDPTGVDKWIEDLDSLKADLAGDTFTGVVNDTAQPRAKVKNGTDQSIADATPTVLAFDAEDFDVGTLHDTVTNNSRITVPTGGAGIWLFVANVQFAVFNGTYRQTVQVGKNGTFTGTSLVGVDQRTIYSSGQGDEWVQVVGLYTTADADYFEVRVEQTSGSSLLVKVGSTFQAAKLW